ncbi:hypothetical protein BSR29_05585 [Boudabousia liubingyangii]|uniref:Uncharacterized protein n=1 Tax=Boudabousia liubingyangii TaxID=1921764 RepID=A0A1Q5PLM3_9ACTO|nr:hypothetical protein [Boudabousia liubingyangii]OKL46938.1 hypothetical protein BSR28_05820 [Boudabousia liubingyangii]OKL47952.1 hypothetical protein BSR29_05585 [Boudabousia liubingyangii]
MHLTSKDRSRQIITTVIAGIGLVLLFISRFSLVQPPKVEVVVTQEHLLGATAVGTWLMLPIALGALAFTIWQWFPSANTIDFQRKFWLFPACAIFLFGLYELFSTLYLNWLAYLILLVQAVVVLVLLRALPASPLNFKGTGPGSLLTLVTNLTFGLLGGWTVYLLVADLARPLTNYSWNWFVRHLFGTLLLLVLGALLILGGRFVGERLSFYFAGMWALFFICIGDLFVSGGAVFVGLVALLVFCAVVVYIVTATKRTKLKF